MALLALFSPILWDWYKEKVDVTIQIKSVASVISKDLPIQNLEVLYDGKKVEALNRVVIQIENTGRTPITSADVIKPIELEFHDSEIIEAKIATLYPRNLDFSLNMTAANKAVANFSLLNPKDKVTINLLLLGVTAKFDAKARIKNIDEINVIDNLGNKINNPTNLYFFPAILLSILLLWYGIQEFIPSALKRFKVRNTLLSTTHDLYSSMSYKFFLKKLFEEKTLSLKQQEYLSGLFIDYNFPIVEIDKQNIATEINKQEIFKKVALLKNLLIELFMIVVFGLVPVIGMVKMNPLPFPS